MTRVIAGVAGSLRLEVPRSGTRPTSDRVREAIFSTLESRGFVHEAHVLDLYAGSGALGLEAASRGAKKVTLVEKHPQAAQTATRNARTIRFAFENQHCSPPLITVVRRSVQSYLDTLPHEGVDPESHWDTVLLDPPYDLSEHELTANLCSLTGHLRRGAAIIVERSSRSPEPTWPTSMTLVREKRYGETVLWQAEAVIEHVIK